MSVKESRSKKNTVLGFSIKVFTVLFMLNGCANNSNEIQQNDERDSFSACELILKNDTYESVRYKSSDDKNVAIFDNYADGHQESRYFDESGKLVLISRLKDSNSERDYILIDECYTDPNKKYRAGKVIYEEFFHEFKKEIEDEKNMPLCVFLESDENKIKNSLIEHWQTKGSEFELSNCCYSSVSFYLLEECRIGSF